VIGSKEDVPAQVITLRGKAKVDLPLVVGEEAEEACRVEDGDTGGYHGA